MTIAYNMDCLEAMREMRDKEFDLAIADPPYRDINQPIKEMRKADNMKTFGSKPNDEYFEQLFRVSVNQIVWGANNFNLCNYKGFIVWNKLITGVKDKYSEAELAYISDGIGTTSRIFNYSAQTDREIKIHPTQKPVALYRWLLHNYAHPGQNILDTHLGSGSSRIAADQLGFDFTGYELDKDYYEAQEQRFKQYKSQLTLAL